MKATIGKFALLLLLAGIALSLDLQQAGAGSGVLYLAAVLAASLLPGRRWTFSTAGVCSLLVLLAPMIATQPGNPGVVAAGRAMVIAGIWAVALGVARHGVRRVAGGPATWAGSSERAPLRGRNDLQGLLETSLAETTAMSLDEVTRIVTEQARRTVGAHQASTALVERRHWEGAIVECSFSEQVDARGVASVGPQSPKLLAAVCGTNSSVRLSQEQIQANPRWQAELKPRGDRLPLRGWLAVPLIGGDGRNLGLIQLSDKYRGDFNREDQAALEQFAQTASVALELCQAYESLERRVRRRTTELEQVNDALRQQVAERESAEQAVRHQEAVYRSLVESLPLNVFRKDLEGRVVEGNKRYCDTLGMPLAALIGKTDNDLFPAELAKKYRDDDAKVIRTGEVLQDTEEHVKPDGRRIYVEVLKSPVRNANGRIVGVQGMFWDVTDRVRAEHRLQAAKAAADAANRAKSQFLANMSHEIRTPLGGLIGMTDLLLETPLTDRQREFVAMARQSGESLLMVINDILDFSKIEAGKFELHPVAFDVRECAGDTMKMLALKAHQKGLELACHVHPDVPQNVRGDSARLRQVVMNLVGNAVKFTDQGEVVLDVKVGDSDDERGNGRPEGDGHVELEFSVRDTGIGIPEGKLEDIFEAFLQADATTTRKYGGTGLGLSISHRLVELMDGRIWVESRPDRGSTFHFTAQFETVPASATALPSVSAAGLSGLHVLVVDDHETNRQILCEMLDSWSMRPTAASDAKEAMDQLLQAGAKGEPIQVVLTDCQMPDVDGFELAGQIRAEAALDRTTVIIMLSSADRTGDLERCASLGIDSYLVKPVKQSELFDAIVEAIDGRRKPGVSADDDLTAAAGLPGPDLPPLRILVAEDSLINQRLLVGLLENRGHRVVVVDNGQKAVDAVTRETFDVALMDIQMPEMDGLEATRRIRAWQRDAAESPRLPIVAITAHAMQGDRARCIEAGMDAYVTKPIRAERLFDTIAQVAEAPTRPDTPPVSDAPIEPDVRTAEAETAPAETASKRNVPEDARCAAHWETALESAGGNRQLLLELVEVSVGECPRLLGEVRRAIEGGDHAALLLAAHTLKGSIRYFGATEAFDLAFETETAARQEDLETARANLEPLALAIERVVAELQLWIERDETEQE